MRVRSIRALLYSLITLSILHVPAHQFFIYYDL